MEESNIQQAEKEIELQVQKIDRILDKRSDNGQHFEDFLREEKARLYGMLQIYWVMGGVGFKKYKR
jgi:hypothetical protein